MNKWEYMNRLKRLFLALIILSALFIPFAQVEPAKASNTVIIYSTTSDAMLTSSSANYSLVRTAASANASYTTNFTVGQYLGLGTYDIFRSYVIFNTSTIPTTANISSVILHLYGAATFAVDDFDIVVQTGNNTYPHNPVILSDYNYNLYADNFSSLNSANCTTSGYNEFPLSSTGIATVNVTGETRFCLRSLEDINGNAPTAAEFYQFFSANQPGTSQDPYLEIVYTWDSDIIQTNDATDILPTTATLQGELLSTENESFVSVFFEYGSTTAYGTTTIVQNVITTGTFNQSIFYLQYNQTYHFRAVAKIGSSYFYGQDYYFTTMPAVGSTTDMQIVSVAVFSDFLEADDLLFCAEVINTYTGYYPNADPKKYFTIQLLDTNNTDILGATPLYSWGDRPVSIYINAADAANYTDQAGYYIRMIGTLVPGNPSISQQIVAGDWYGYDFAGALDDWCKGTAINMELSDGRDDYLTSLTDQGLAITDEAGGFFSTGIPGITQVRPNLFTTSHITPIIEAGAAVNAWDKGDFAVDGWRSYVGNTTAEDITTIGSPLGLSGKDFAAGLVIFAMFGVIMSIVGATGGWGALGALLIAIPVLWIGIWFRIVPIWIILIMVIIFGLFAVRQFEIKTL